MNKKSSDFFVLKDFYIKVMRVLQKLLSTEDIKKQLSYLRSIKKKAIKKAIALNLSNCEIPIIPILCSSIRHGMIRAKQILLIKYIDSDKKERLGTFELNLAKVSDTKSESTKHDKHPYFIVGVNLNLSNKGLSPQSVMEKRSSSGNVRFLTLTEIIALLIQNPQLLEKYTVLACGSEYKNGAKKLIPCITIQNATPTITKVESDKSDSSFISPTCRERVEVSIINTTSTVIKLRPWKKPNPI